MKPFFFLSSSTAEFTLHTGITFSKRFNGRLKNKMLSEIFDMGIAWNFKTFLTIFNGSIVIYCVQCWWTVQVHHRTLYYPATHLSPPVHMCYSKYMENTRSWHRMFNRLSFHRDENICSTSNIGWTRATVFACPTTKCQKVNYGFRLNFHHIQT